MEIEQNAIALQNSTAMQDGAPAALASYRGIPGQSGQALAMGYGDRIRIVDLEIFANHGVFPEENTLGQKFLVSATLYADLRPAGESDELADSIDYGAVCRLIDRTMREQTSKLIEHAAERVASAILGEYPAVAHVTIELKKPWAPVGMPLAYASVVIERSR